ncbi:MAG: UDP-N-acetylmuramoyl-tripeptide--D-alanyl-D-alanine ligase [Pseudomonadales bacterium]|nr:UDP-N-acetylmuramoyl-tripeptide--D-alanyl-D-alanine ligase [Pseudomonadales bacterium]
MSGAALWRWDELRAALAADGPETGPDVTGVSLDSRSLAPGDLFFALSGGPDPRYRGAAGSGRDGHDFVVAAAAAGAPAAVVSRPTGAALAELRVDDPFDALWRLGAAARERFAAPVFALTGSAGKTTAKGMLAAALEALCGSVHASAGSLNNHLGVPLSLGRMPRDARAAVFELGMNSPGEIAPLSRLVRPDVVAVLNVMGVHLEGLGSLEAIRREKLSITAGLGPEGVLVVHDEVDVHDLPRGLRRVTFGRSEAADVRLLDEGYPNARPSVELRLPDSRTLTAGHLADGPHRRMTACGVLACLFAAGLDPAPAIAAIEALAPPPGRGGQFEAGGVTVVDDSYNANPESVRQAIAGLFERPGAGRWALLADMLELGPEEAVLHAGLAEACTGLDGVFCVGPLMGRLHDALPSDRRAGWWPDCDALELDAVLARVAPGDVLLVKGSNRFFWKHGTVRSLTEALEARAREVSP